MMKISGGIIQNGVVVGNNYDKYASGNPLVKKIMSGFENALDELVTISSAHDIHEIGCGEGYWVIRLKMQGKRIRGCDFSSSVIDIAKSNAKNAGIEESLFETKSIYDLTYEQDKADLVVCCEVLEHLEEPDSGLKALQRIVENRLIISVPREPIWRGLNMIRGKYLNDFGNTPGHIQHWSYSGFIRMIERYFHIIEIRTPLPWTMLLCRPYR